MGGNDVECARRGRRQRDSDRKELDFRGISIS
jgi:hypothetical protein